MEERKGFGTNFGFLMASVGSAVGLGNIWGFPNKMGASGGFTFLIVYLILAVLCGFIVMVSELALGRKTGKGVVSAYHALSKKFKWVGWLGILSPFFILFFYCALGGDCIKYTVLNIGDLFHASFGANALAEQAATNGTSLGAEVFGAFMANPNELMIGWELGPDVVKDECEASGHAMSGYGFFKVCVKFITPLCMILVLYGQIKEFFF